MKLNQFLKMASITQREFAGKIGVSPNSVARYVSGLRLPSKDEMQRIVAETNGDVTPNDFFDIPAPSRTRASRVPARAHEGQA